MRKQTFLVYKRSNTYSLSNEVVYYTVGLISEEHSEVGLLCSFNLISHPPALLQNVLPKTVEFVVKKPMLILKWTSTFDFLLTLVL